MSSVYLAKGVQATTAIEGNTLSTDEVQNIVDHGSANVSESRSYLEREVQNVLTAVRELDAALQDGIRLPIDVARLCELNYKVLDGIPDKPEDIRGRIREHDVGAGVYTAPHYTDVPELTDRFVKWIDQLRSKVSPASRREAPSATATVASPG